MFRMTTGLSCLLLIACGCWQPKEIRQMGFQGAPPKVPASEAIANFMGREGMTALYMNFDELSKQTAGARAAVTDPKFVDLFEAFKIESIPKGFDSTQRQQAKTEFVEAIEALMKGVKDKVSDDEFRKLAEPIRPAAEAFMRPTNY